ncbi:hypothetical protein EI94DRAFT_1697161 [Lactarius quietus]|nr:hypothetical protein EI94DRAFT_1697161 [Lactarius quietus]
MEVVLLFTLAAYMISTIEDAQLFAGLFHRACATSHLLTIQTKIQTVRDNRNLPRIALQDLTLTFPRLGTTRRRLSYLKPIVEKPYLRVLIAVLPADNTLLAIAETNGATVSRTNPCQFMPMGYMGIY